MLNPRSIKGLFLIFLFMSCGLFTWLSIMDHYTDVSHSMGEILWNSVFTGIVFSAINYWWAGRSESDEDEVAMGEQRAVTAFSGSGTIVRGWVTAEEGPVAPQTRHNINWCSISRNWLGCEGRGRNT